VDTTTLDAHLDSLYSQLQSSDFPKELIKGALENLIVCILYLMEGRDMGLVKLTRYIIIALCP